MKKICVFLFLCFTAWTCYAQQKDTLKHSSPQEIDDLQLNREDAIRKKPFIGPPPEHLRTNRGSENESLKRLLREEPHKGGRKQDVINGDSLPALRISDEEIKMWKALDKIYHRKTTVDDTQTLANPHIKVSFDEILCFLFRPDLRAKMRNKKKANAYKTY